MLKIAICDNTELDSFKMIKKINQIARNMKISGIYYYIFDSAEKLINQLDMKFDVIFIEVQLKNSDGVTMGKKIREKDDSVMVVFCSRTFLISPDIFKIRPYRFLVKEEGVNMETDIKEILKRLIKNSEKYFCFQKNNTIYKIDMKDIIYITSIKRGCRILYRCDDSTVNPNSVICNKKLKDIIDLIHDERFVLAHNSYAVNLEHIHKVTKTEVLLSTNICLSVARSKEKELKMRIAGFYKNKYIYLE